MKHLILSILLGASFSLFANSEADNKAVAEQYFSFLEAGNIEGLMNILDDDIIWHQPGKNILSGTHVGKEQVAELFRQFMVNSEGSLRVKKESIMVNDSLVNATLSFSASRCRYFDVTINMKGTDLMRIENGKIKEVYLFSENQDEEDAFWGLKL